MDDSGAQQSNPFSTGGGGPNFETRVQAAFALTMLTGRVAPCLPPYPIHLLKLQGRYAGFHFDDFVAYARDPGSGREAKLLAQIKHQVTIADGDDTLADVMNNAWRDFNDPSFDHDTDAIALITGPLTATDTQNVRPLLEWARHSAAETEFLEKMGTKKFSSEAKRNKVAVLRKRLDHANGDVPITDRQLWSFLKRFHLIGYDLDTETGSTHALLLSLIALSSSQPPNLLWSRLVDAIQTANQNAGTVTRETLPSDLRAAFDVGRATAWTSDVERLRVHGGYILGNIKTGIGGVHIEREEDIAHLLGLTESASLVWVTGPRGSGKSSLIRTVAERLGERAPVFCLRAEDLNQPSLAQVFTALGLRGSLSDLEVSFALLPKKYLFIESLEKLLELDYKGAFQDLLQFLKKHPGWTVVATGREYAYQPVAFEFLEPAATPPAVLRLEGFEAEQVEVLCQRLEALQGFAANPELAQLLRTPFFADLAYRVAQAGTLFEASDGEREFRTAVWRDVIAKESERAQGMPAKRRRAFVEIAVQRAKQMVYGVPEEGFDPEAVAKLEEDHLIARDPGTRRLSPAHDVLEDWALEEFIDYASLQHERDAPAMLKAIGSEPAMNRAFRLWLQQRLRDGDGVDGLILEILQDPMIARYWQDEAITAVLQSDAARSFLDRLMGRLLEGDGDLLRRFCFLVRVSCQMPNLDLFSQFPTEATRGLRGLILQPFGPGWGALITFLLEHKEIVSADLLPHVAAVLKQWSGLLNVQSDPPALAREVGLLALHLLTPLKTQYRDTGTRTSLLEVILKTAAAIPNELSELLERDVFALNTDRERLAYVRDLCRMAFALPETAFVSRSQPDLLIRLAWAIWPLQRDEDDLYQSSIDVDERFGLHEVREFFPASGAKGPFQHIMRHHGWKGVDFVLELCNHAAEHYVHSGLDRAWVSSQDGQNTFEQIHLTLEDGTVVTQYVSDRLWLAYRGHSVVPYVLQCALMALENWIIAVVELADSTTPNLIYQVFDRVLRKSNSVLTTAVLASVATGFPQKAGRAALPILHHAVFYSLDINRMVHEMGESELNFFATERDAFAQLYAQERREAALRPWRRDRLESVIVQLQFSEHREQALEAIDAMREASTGTDSERFLFHRIDSRGWRAEPDEENARIVFLPNDLEPDLAAQQEETQEASQRMNRFSALSLWATKTFDGDGPSDAAATYPSWREALTEARALLKDREPDNPLGALHAGGIVKAAAVALRDHLGELQSDEATWCAAMVVGAVERGDVEGDPLDDGSIDLDGASAAATVLPKLLELAHDESERRRVRELIALAVTHMEAKVRLGAAEGVREHLWRQDPVFAWRCAVGALAFARLQQDLLTQERRRRTRYEDLREGTLRAWHRSKEKFRRALVEGRLRFAPDAVRLTSHSSYFLVTAGLMIPDGSLEPDHVRLLSSLLQAVVLSEQHDDDRSERQKPTIPLEQRLRFNRRFARYLVDLEASVFEPFVGMLHEACDRAPDLVDSLQINMAVSAERLNRKGVYWKFWRTLAPKVREIALETALEVERFGYRDDPQRLIRSFVFADAPWQKVDYENQDIALGKPFLIDFATQAGMNRHVFEGLASLVYHFPALFLEEGVHVLADWQRATQATPISGNTAFYLEISIQRYLQVDRPGPLSRRVYDSCLVLLSKVVETASARAYHLREQLVRSRMVA